MKKNIKKFRKKFFVDKNVQGALVRRFFLQWLLFFTATAIALPIWEIMLSGDFLSPSSQAIQEAWKHTAPVFLFLLLLLPAFVWDTVTLTNRFAGPMHRLRGAIRDAAAGKDIEPLNFRDDDFWRDVAGDFNTLLERLPRESETNAEHLSEKCETEHDLKENSEVDAEAVCEEV